MGAQLFPSLRTSLRKQISLAELATCMSGLSTTPQRCGFFKRPDDQTPSQSFPWASTSQSWNMELEGASVPTTSEPDVQALMSIFSVANPCQFANILQPCIWLGSARGHRPSQNQDPLRSFPVYLWSEHHLDSPFSWLLSLGDQGCTCGYAAHTHLAVPTIVPAGSDSKASRIDSAHMGSKEIKLSSSPLREGCLFALFLWGEFVLGSHY